jgi:hypothetical protein
MTEALKERRKVLDSQMIAAVQKSLRESHSEESAPFVDHQIVLIAQIDQID